MYMLRSLTQHWRNMNNDYPLSGGFTDYLEIAFSIRGNTISSSSEKCFRISLHNVLISTTTSWEESSSWEIFFSRRSMMLLCSCMTRWHSILTTLQEYTYDPVRVTSNILFTPR